MRKLSKATLGIMAYTPLVSFLMTMGFVMFCSIMEEAGASIGSEEEVIVIVGLLISFICVISAYVDMAVFIIRAGENRKLSVGEKVMWGVLMYFFNIFVFPIFWHVRVLPDKGQEMM